MISTFPYIVPPDLTNREAAAAPSSQTFMLVGTLVLLPIILAYSPRARRITDPDAGAPSGCVQRARGGKRVNAAPAFPPVELGLQAQAPEPGLWSQAPEPGL